MTSSSELTAEELLHLAMQASNTGKNKEAIEYLKQASLLDSADGNIHYMLGAMYAQIGMYEQAMLSMGTALDRDPTLDTARFQLGLLYLTSGDVDQASHVWKELDHLAPTNYLYLFKTGLLELANNELETALQSLIHGIEANASNEALNSDMAKIIDDINYALGTPTDSVGESQARISPQGHAFLSAYKDNDEENS